MVSRDTFPVRASTFTVFSTDNPVDSFILDLYFYKRTTKWIVDSSNNNFVSFVKCIWIVFIKTNVSVVLDNFTKTSEKKCKTKIKNHIQQDSILLS